VRSGWDSVSLLAIWAAESNGGSNRAFEPGVCLSAGGTRGPHHCRVGHYVIAPSRKVGRCSWSRLTTPTV
jgi:hypothetical protein